jgi:hypothetical protein
VQRSAVDMVDNFQSRCLSTYQMELG